MSEMKKNVDDIKENVMEDLKEEQTSESKKSKFVKELISWVKVFAVAIVVAYIISNFVIINANVPTGSMEKLIMPGDRMIGFRLSYTFNEPERGDVVIFRFPDNEEEIYVKRLIGLPGETVTIKDAKIYINDSTEPLKEDYLPEEWTTNNGSDEPLVFKVPEGEYFMMGDNRNSSYDARSWNDHYVNKDQIVAKALFVYYPFDDMKWLRSAEYDTNVE